MVRVVIVTVADIAPCRFIVRLKPVEIVLRAVERPPEVGGDL
jgi:hypothetical protein